MSLEFLKKKKTYVVRNYDMTYLLIMSNFMLCNI